MPMRSIDIAFVAQAIDRIGIVALARHQQIAAVGSTEETDGIDVVTGDFGSDFPGGLFVAQDGQNAPSAQNFKLAAWADIKAALGLE